MGPTGTGKSALALRVAQNMPTVIINADAMQMVDGLRIITARPTVEEEQQAEHALYGVLPPAEPTNVKRWLELVQPVIERAWSEGKLPLLVGGTGMYVKALHNGLAQVPPVPAEIRERVRAMKLEDVRRVLQEKDPFMAAQLKPGDTQRSMRALEVMEATGRSLLAWQKETSEPAFPEASYSMYQVTVPREELYQRLDARFEKMMNAGALEEVRALMALKLPEDTPILRAHGVPELMAYLRGEMGRAEAIEQAKQNTRNYAKRQMTWLRHQLSGAKSVAPDSAGL